MGLTLGRGLGVGMKKLLALAPPDIIPSFSDFATSAIGDNGFTVSATVNPKGAATTIVIEYGLTEAYGSTQAVVAGSPVNATGTISAVLSGLQQNKTYNWRIKATRDGVTNYSANQVQATTNLKWILPFTGPTGGTPTTGVINMSLTEDVTPTATGDVTFTKAIANDGIYVRHNLTVSCPVGGSGTIVFPDRNKIVALCNVNGTSNPTFTFYTVNNATGPRLTLEPSDIPSTVLKIRQNAAYIDAFKSTLTDVHVPLPPNIIYFYIDAGSNFHWKHEGQLPSSLTFAYIRGGTMKFIKNGGTLPQSMIFLVLDSAGHDFVNTDFSGNGNITTFALTNWRVTKIGNDEMITILNSLKNRVGTLPATITINDYANSGAVPQAVTDAVNQLKAAKSITTVNLGA